LKVIHHSFGGRFSDSPRAIYQALRASGYPARHIWLMDPAHRHGFPAGVETVEYGSERCIRELESADVVVSNTHIELDWNKSPDTRYLQTWHGTPLKHIHFDSLWAPPGRVAYLTEDVRRWDYLLSPNRASTERLRAAFGFAGPVAETGYPRNDVLLSPQRDVIRAEVRRRLGIPEDATVVLYTPTWRDDILDAQGRQDFSLQLDVEKFHQQLGDDHYLLIRTHFLVTADLPAMDGPRVRDVSAHPDVSELYLAADAMVTDYSSTMFDFAVTGKPLLFYTYDLHHYRDSLRGFYFDLHQYAPGPILHTSDGVMQALGDLDAVRLQYAEAYAAFRDQFCHLDDGAATARVIARFFPPAIPAELRPTAAETAVLTPAPAAGVPS
jgi:CDP-glycerol glycerophosphotransferase